MENEISRIFQLIMHKGIEVPVFQQKAVARMYELYKMPEEKLLRLSNDDFKKYINGLYKSQCEIARDWTEGHRILVKLGFKEVHRNEDHRRFTSLIWEKEN